MHDRFRQQVIVVAGGTGGLGRAVSNAFLAEGKAIHGAAIPVDGVG